MTYSPCGTNNPKAPCMKNDNCSKCYPRPFTENTIINEDGYPAYARPNNGRTYEKRGKTLDNRDVVSYNGYLSLTFDCHVNVELTFSIKSMKYMHKYVHKGPDRTTMEIGRPQDEGKQFLDSRYVGPHKGFWRLMGNELHTQVPAVMTLSIHLPGEQMSFFILIKVQMRPCKGLIIQQLHL
jgi:hypothetical protein